MSPETSQPEASPNGLGDWDYLSEMHKNCAAYTCVPALLTPFIRNEELLARVPDNAQLTEMATVLAKDVQTFAAKLNEIRQLHADKVGSTKDPDDHMRCIGINENYIRWALSYESVVIPQVLAILDIFEAAGADTAEIRTSISTNQTQG